MSIHAIAERASQIAASTAFVFCSLLGVARPVIAEVQTAVEYGFYYYWDDCYYIGNTGVIACAYRSYFVTTSPDEMAWLDAGGYNTYEGQFVWERTGETFNVWSGPEGGALPTCRFFNPKFGVEHVYTPYPAECEAVKANVGWGWQLEGMPFYLQLPDADGDCATGTTSLYRLYWDKGGPPVHRLITDAAKFNQMLAQGWTFEGDGRTFVFACVPSRL